MMMENDEKIVAEEWLNELIEELWPGTRRRIEKALKENSVDELDRRDELLYTFIKDFQDTWGNLPSSLIKK